MKNNLTVNQSFDQINQSDWEELIALSPQASVFQTSEMFLFWKEQNGHEPFVFSVHDPSDQLIALCLVVIMANGNPIKRELTKRAIVFGGPVVKPGEEASDALAMLLEAVDKTLRRKAIYIESRNLSDYHDYVSTFKSSGWKYKEHLNFHVNCTDEVTTVKRMSKSKIRQVKKSLNEGAQIIEAQSLEHVRAFYDILHELYKTKVKTPLPDFSFFQSFFEGKLGKYLLIEFEGDIVGGIMCPILNGKVIYEWYVCGLDGKIKNIYPSIVATWAAIQFAVQNQIPRFDFMGAGPPNRDYGVREFKSKFGGELVEHGRFIRVFKPLYFKIGKLAVRLLKKGR